MNCTKIQNCPALLIYSTNLKKYVMKKVKQFSNRWRYFWFVFLRNARGCAPQRGRHKRKDRECKKLFWENKISSVFSKSHKLPTNQTKHLHSLL